MSNDGVRVSWRAAVLPGNGGAAMYGHLCRISKSKAVVRMDHNLSPGQRCNLVLMLPKRDASEPNHFVEGNCTVTATVLARMQFHVTFEWSEIKGNGETLLQERLGLHKQMWSAAY